MRVLILNWRDISHPLSGGAEIVTMEYAKGWVRSGHSVTWFTSSYPNAKPVETIDGVKMIRRAGFFTVYPAAMLYVLFHSGDYDVVVDEVHGFPFFSVLFTRLPVVVFIHEIAGEIWDFMYSFPVNIIGRFVESWYFYLYKHCIFWTVANSTVHELVAKGVDKKQCYAVSCPIVINRKDVNIEKIVPIKEKNPTYIFVSRVVKMKGIEEVIKAFSFIQKEQPTSSLWIVGNGEATYFSELKRMVYEYGVSEHVTFFGKVDEKKKFELLAKSHILLHASVKEGWGLVVLEAALVGTPSVVYNVSGLRDIVKSNKTGKVVQNNSPKEMARESILLYKDKLSYRKFQNEGRKWVNSIRWDDSIRSSITVLEKAIEAKKFRKENNRKYVFE